MADDYVSIFYLEETCKNGVFSPGNFNFSKYWMSAV